jgi:hypothetical protein
MTFQLMLEDTFQMMIQLAFAQCDILIIHKREFNHDISIKITDSVLKWCFKRYFI